MTANQYLQNILFRERVDTSINSPVRSVIQTIQPIVSQWAGEYLLNIGVSGSFAKGTANNSGTDIDIFISLSSGVTNSLKEIYESLFDKFKNAGYSPKKQNVSLNIRVGGYSVNLAPAKQQPYSTTDHSLYKNQHDTWTKTNVDKHIQYVANSNRLEEIRIIKLWRHQKGISFPSFYLEMASISTLSGKYGDLSNNVWSVFQYLSDNFVEARFVDPANTNNVISDDLTYSEKQLIKKTANAALTASKWNQIVV